MRSAEASTRDGLRLCKSVQLGHQRDPRRPQPGEVCVRWFSRQRMYLLPEPEGHGALRAGVCPAFAGSHAAACRMWRNSGFMQQLNASSVRPLCATVGSESHGRRSQHATTNSVCPGRARRTPLLGRVLDLARMGQQRPEVLERVDASAHGRVDDRRVDVPTKAPRSLR